MAHSNEASVEEILESIKKVIARDNRDDAMATRRRRETDGVVESHPKADAFQASEMEKTAIPATDTDSDKEVLDLGEMEFAEHIDAPQAGEETSEESDHDSAATVALSASDEALTTDEARATMRENLEALAMIAQPSAPPQIVRSGETSLEGMTRELLRPMLAEWLDANLPDMVEALVKEEIARIARKDS